METEYPKGAEWRKWDLHLHTPSSYDYHDKSTTNEMIISKLKEYEIRVVAITDHHIIDIERIKKLKELGEREGITVLPGIEFLSDARGREPIHFIGIFPEDCNLNYVWGQIKNNTGIREIEGNSRKINEVYCNLIETINLVHELDGIITIHAGKKPGSVETITNSLEHTIAQKTDIANSVDIYELGKESDQKDYRDIVFPSIGKQLPLIICSDNHDIKNYSLKQNCWFKADPNFNGLRQVINEPVGRAFIGNKPYILEKVQNNKTKYIAKISIDQINDYNGSNGIWFKNIQIPMNNGLVAIIGNKGSGKSAIADIISLCSNYFSDKDFSFLNSKKFREKSGKIAKNFKARLIWESGNESMRNLNETPEDSDVLRVKYIPQGQFENLTNEISSVENFQKEIESVVFSHIPDSERLGTFSFAELINKKSTAIEMEFSSLLDDINEINREIINLENQKTETYKLGIKNKFDKKNDELEALTEPKEVTDPNVDLKKRKQSEELNKTILQKKVELTQIHTKIQESGNNKKLLNEDIELLNRIKKELEQKKYEIDRFISEKREELVPFKIKVDSIISLSVDTRDLESIINKKKENLELEKEKLGELISDTKDNNLYIKYNQKKLELKTEMDKLNSEQKSYQDYILAKEAWESAKQAIIGTVHAPDTIEYYKAIIDYINNDLEKDLNEKYEKRLKLVRKVFEKKQEVIFIYKEAREKLNKIIEDQADILKEYSISVEAALALNSSFESSFLNFIDKGKAGSFYSKAGGEVILKKIIEDIDFDNIEDIIVFLNKIMFALHHDVRNEYNEIKNVSDQVKNTLELYNYLFSLSFLELNYQLKQGTKNIEQLSPGERGALLLVFYLLLDKNDIPLIIDQPEDNLDNNSVATVLVPFIREAKKKRQIIMVTHNPNLAVVSDAEQIIYVNLDKKDNNRFSIISGSIENKKINTKIVEVLEGAMPAFNIRKRKYYDN